MKKPHFKAAAILSVALLGSTHALAEQTKILFNSFIPHNHFFNQDVLLPWLDMVNKATEGRVVFEVPPTTLAAPQAQYDGVKKGIFDAAYIANPFIYNIIKLPSIAQLPFTAVSAQASTLALWKTQEKYFDKANEFKDVHLFAHFVGLGGDIVSAKAPIHSAADLNGMKMYALPGSTANMLTAAGAAVVAGPAVRSYELISSGTVDGFGGLATLDFEMFKSLQYGKQIVRVPGGTAAPVFSFFMSKKKWAAISAKDQATINQLAREPMAKLIGAAYDKRAADLDKRLTAEGMPIEKPSPEFMAELEKLAQPSIDAWLQEAQKLGVDGKAALAYYQAQAKAIDKTLAH